MARHQLAAVRGEQHGRSDLGQLDEQPHQAGDKIGIEIAGRLVGEQQPRPAHDGTGRRDELTLALRRQMQRFPILLCPVASGPAFRHGEGNFGSPGVNYLDAMRYCQWFNLTGNPAAVVPAGRSAEGLPIGVQVVARHHREEEALAVARAIERVTGGFRRPPL